MENFEEVKKREVVCAWVQDEARSRLCLTKSENVYVVKKEIVDQKEETTNTKIAQQNSALDFMILGQKYEKSNMTITKFVK